VLHDDGQDLHQSELIAVLSVVVLDLVMIDLFNRWEEVVLDIDLHDLVEEVFFLEGLLLLKGGIVCLFKDVDAFFDLSPA
jgi:hypothetical protein